VTKRQYKNISASVRQHLLNITQWRGFIRKNRLTNVSQDLGEVVTTIAAFLGPIAKSLAAKQPFKANWKAPGPWVE